MNSIRRISELNQREIECGVSPEASWHVDYRDTAYIYIGGLPLELSEGDVITIFSQYGNPTFVNLVRDKETGKSRGFAFLKYEDQRSTDLAVDNLGGAVILGRTLNVDHTRYQRKDEELKQGQGSTPEPSTTDKNHKDKSELEDADYQSENSSKRLIIKEEQELAKLIRDLDDEDPMKPHFIQEKREQVALALARQKGNKKHKSSHKHHSHRHRSTSKRVDTKGPLHRRDSRDCDSGRHRRHRKHD